MEKIEFLGKILIVDDTPLNVLALKRTLSKKGYEIKAVESGNEAIKLVALEKPDLILLDIMMPDLNGFEVCQILKDNPKTKSIPVIFLSALNETDDKIKAFNSGGVDFITRPYDINEVVVRVETHLELNRLRISLEEKSKELKTANDQLKSEVIERENAEEELNVTMKCIGDAIISANEEDTIILINKAVKDIFGYDKDELYGKTMIELFEILKTDYEINERKVDYNSLYSMNPNEPLQVSEKIEIVTKYGLKKTLLCSSAEVKKQGGSAIGFVYVFKDITKQIEIETQLLLSQKLESIGQLAAGIAHEINTPMQYINDNTTFLEDAFNSIKNYIESMETFAREKNSEIFDAEIKNRKASFDIEYLVSEIPAAIAQSKVGIDRVSNIVRAMKDFSHPAIKEKIYSDINHGIEVTAIISKNEWKYVADLELKLDSTIPQVLCNIDEINQVILNMIINGAHAIKEKIGDSSEEKGKITVTTYREKDYVGIEISDTGAGIAEENLTRIFNPFFTTKEVGKGTGQGLAIAHNIIVNNHKGTINVASEVGKGTTFTIRIPIESEEKDGR